MISLGYYGGPKTNKRQFNAYAKFGGQKGCIMGDIHSLCFRVVSKKLGDVGRLEGQVTQE